METDFCEKNLNTPLHRIFKAWLKFCTFNYIDPIITGLENIPVRGGAIIASNHADVSDGVYIGLASDRPIRFLVAKQLASIPIFGRLIAWLGDITVARDGSMNDSKALYESIESLKKGFLLGVFPEGKVNFGKNLLPFRTGIARMALSTGMPIIPTGIYGTEQIIGTNKIARYGKISIHFDNPIIFNKINKKPTKNEIDLALDVIRLRIIDAHSEAKRNYLQTVNPTPSKLIKRAIATMFLAPFTFMLKTLGDPLFSQNIQKPAS